MNASREVMLNPGAIADTAPPGEGGRGVPVPGDCLMALGGFRAPFGDVIGPVDGEVAGEEEDLLLVVAQPAAERAAGMIPAVPVAQPVAEGSLTASSALAVKRVSLKR